MFPRRADCQGIPRAAGTGQHLLMNMKKRVVFSLLFFTGTYGLFAQSPLVGARPSDCFNAGKELYDEGKYAAASRYFEASLLSAEATEAGLAQEAEYYIAAAAFKVDRDDAKRLLSRYLVRHPYSPFADQVNFMLGCTAFRAKDYNLTLSYFQKVDEKNIDRYDVTTLQYYKAYSLMQTDEYEQATALFKRLLEKETRYNQSVKYYYAYCEYIQSHFETALPYFLQLENIPDYGDIVPYYIIQIYYDQGDYAQIGDRAERLLASNPDNANNAEIYRIMGEISYAQGEYSKTIDYLKRYEKMSGQVLRNDMYLLGLSYYQTGNYTEAILYLSKVTVAQDAMTENAYLHIGNSYVKTGEKDNARMAYEAALGTSFDSTVREEALYNYALATYESDAAFGEAINAFEKLLDEFPNSQHADKAYNYLVSAYMTAKNFTAAYNSIQKVSRPGKELLAAKQYLLNRLGSEDFSRQDYTQALNRFTEALAHTPNKDYAAESYYWRAETYYRTGKYKEALADLQSFRSNSRSVNSPNLKASYYLEGYVLFSLKRYDQALKSFKTYVSEELSANDPTYADVMNRIGDCYFHNRNFAEAEKNYTTALVASPHTGDYPLFQTAYVNGLQKKYNSKINALHKLVADYPKSQYADDALYEAGRSYLMLDDEERALQTFDRLITSYPNSTLAPAAALEKGMVYFNRNDLDKAIEAFKYVIATYPGCEESTTALKSLETAYVEQNNVEAYITYTQSLGGSVRTAAISREDSLIFTAAERQYMNHHYQEAINGLNSYITKFCTNENSATCTTARYYLADSYYATGNKESALGEFEQLAKIAGNKYMEEAVTRAAEITYDKQDYLSSLAYFTQLDEVAHDTETKNVARLGVLRCSYFLNDHAKTIAVAEEIMDDPSASDDTKEEARYDRAKAYFAQGYVEQALSDFQAIAENTRTPNGAEAKYLIAEIHFNNKNLDEAEATITDFARKNTPYQYWLAKSFVLLADIYVARGDDFQAKQYLLSLQKNYTADDDIQPMITERMESIGQREQQNIIN